MTEFQYRKHLMDELRKAQSGLSDFDFDSYILQLFEYQYKYNAIYHKFCAYLKINSNSINTKDKIPLLPISAFKYNLVFSGDWNSLHTFKSSGTTSVFRSQHLVREIDDYTRNALSIWAYFYGPIEEYCFLALLPGYIERGESSLVCMMNKFVNLTEKNGSGFYLYDHVSLQNKLLENKSKKIKTVLFGVSFALLNFMEEYSLDFADLIVVETGGMKGLRAEMTKEELFVLLVKGFGTKHIHSEFGMTELFSQAYAMGNLQFKTPKMMDVVVKQINDPLTDEKQGSRGILGVLDGANIDSCAFILTEDLARKIDDKSFELCGRMEDSDIRGCNLLLEDMM